MPGISEDHAATEIRAAKTSVLMLIEADQTYRQGTPESDRFRAMANMAQQNVDYAENYFVMRDFDAAHRFAGLAIKAADSIGFEKDRMARLRAYWSR